MVRMENNMGILNGQKCSNRDVALKELRPRTDRPFFGKFYYIVLNPTYIEGIISKNYYEKRAALPG